MDDDEWRKSPSKKKKTLRLEYRLKHISNLRKNSWFNRLKDWTPYYTKYSTEAQREQALKTLNRKDTLFEYRIPEDK